MARLNARVGLGTAAVDTLFTVSLERALDEDKDAPSSTATLPAPFDIGPLSKTTFSRGEDLVVTWEPSGMSDNMDIEVDGDCISSPSGNFTVSGDPGTFTIAANELESFDSDMPESCSATVTSRTVIVTVLVADSVYASSPSTAVNSTVYSPACV